MSLLDKVKKVYGKELDEYCNKYPSLGKALLDELDSKYFPLYVSSNYQIGTGKEVEKKLSKKKGLGYTVYGQINPDYFTGKSKEVIKDNSALKKQIVNILQTTMAQNEADKKFSDVFSKDEGFKKYLVYEAASGAYKYTVSVPAPVVITTSLVTEEEVAADLIPT